MGHSGGLADAVEATDYGILDGADWSRRGGLGRTRGLADAANYGILDGADWGGRGGRGGRSGLSQTGRTRGRAEWRIGRTTESWTGRSGAHRADGANWGGRGGQDGGGRIGSSLEGRKGRTGKPGGACQRTRRTDWDAHVQVGCGLWGHLAPYTADPHQILRCSCHRPLLGDSHFEGAKSLYQ